MQSHQSKPKVFQRSFQKGAENKQSIELDVVLQYEKNSIQRQEESDRIYVDLMQNKELQGKAPENDGAIIQKFGSNTQTRSVKITRDGRFIMNSNLLNKFLSDPKKLTSVKKFLLRNIFQNVLEDSLKTSKNDAKEFYSLNYNPKVSDNSTRGNVFGKVYSFMGVIHSEEKSLIHGHYVGSILNNLKHKVPNFMFTLGVKKDRNISENPLYFKDQFKSWGEHTFSNVLEKYFSKTDPVGEDMLGKIICMICFSLHIANSEYGFVHGNLGNLDNIIVAKLPENKTYYYNVENTIYAIETDTIPVIMNFENSFIFDFGNVPVYISDQADPADNFKDVRDTLSAIQGKNSDRENAFSNLNDLSDISGVIKRFYQREASATALLSPATGMKTAPSYNRKWHQEHGKNSDGSQSKIPFESIVSYFPFSSMNAANLASQYNTDQFVLGKIVNFPVKKISELPDFLKPNYHSYSLNNQVKNVCKILGVNVPPSYLTENYEYRKNDLATLDFLKKKVEAVSNEDFHSFFEVYNDYKLFLSTIKYSKGEEMFGERQNHFRTLAFEYFKKIYRRESYNFEKYSRDIEDLNVELYEKFPDFRSKIDNLFESYYGNVFKSVVGGSYSYVYPASYRQLYTVVKMNESRIMSLLNKHIFVERTGSIRGEGIKEQDLVNILHQSTETDLQKYKFLSTYAKPLRSNKDKRIQEISTLFSENGVKFDNQTNTYLDFGGGDGELAFLVKEKYKLKKESVYRMDIPSYVNFMDLDKTAQIEKIKNEITWVDIKPEEKLPVQDAFFDVVTCLQVLHHVKNLDFVLSEFQRVIKIGGTLCVREHDCKDTEDFVLCDIDHSLFDLVRQPFTEKKVRDVNTFMSFYISKKILEEKMKDYSFFKISNDSKIIDRNVTKIYNSVFVRK